jgi:hypothetical protein
MAKLNWKKVGNEIRKWKQGTQAIGVARNTGLRKTAGAPCGICLTGEAVSCVGPYGRFMGCSRYPDCTARCKVSASGEAVGEWWDVWTQRLNRIPPSYNWRNR